MSGARPARPWSSAEAWVPSPFVPMSGRARAAVLGVTLAYAATVALGRISSGGGGDDAGVVLVVLGLFAYLVVLAVPIVRAEATSGWFHPLVFTSVTALAELLRRLPMYVDGLERHVALPGYGGAELDRLLAFELLLMAVGLVAYYAGFFTTGGAEPEAEAEDETPVWEHLAVRVLLTTAIAAAAFVVFLGTQGGLTEHVLSWGSGRREALGGQFYWTVLIGLGTTACTLWITLDSAAWRNPFFWLAAAVSLGMEFFFSGSRSAVIVPVLTGMFVHMLNTGRARLLGLAAVGLAALLALNMLGSFRRSTYTGQVDWSRLTDVSFLGDEESELTGEVVRRATIAEGRLPILARVPGDVPLLYGSSYATLLVLPVPRALWPDKPVSIGGRVGATFFGTNSGVPPGVLGEAYWNFHIPGVIVAFALQGVFHRWWHDRLLRRAGSPVLVLLYVLTLRYGTMTTPALFNYLLALGQTLAVAAAFGVLRAPAAARRS